MSINQAPSLTTADANGIVIMDFGSFRVSAPNAVLLADGKILVDGYASNTHASAFYSVLVRYNADGSVDTTFGNGGFVRSDTESTSLVSPEAGVALQADGKIVVGGDGFAVARYNSDGSFDTSFGTGGSVPVLEVGTSLSYGVVVEPDGKIVVSGGNDDFGLVRFDSSGNLDPSFGVGGKATASFDGSVSGDAQSLVGQPDGKILVVGGVDIAGDEDFALVRYNTDGSLDGTFGTGGKVTTDFGSEGDEAFGVALQADGKIVVTGTTTNSTGVLVRYNANGSLDTSFGTGGKVTTNAVSSVEHPETVKIQADGKIVVAGYSFAGGANTDFAIARYNSDGSLDSSFGSAGKVLTDIGATTDHVTSIVIEPDGKILVVGSSGPVGAGPADLALVRYNSDGSLDTSFGNGATLKGPVFFVEDGSPTVLNAGATVHDVELETAGSYAGASLTLARHSGANSDDAFGASGNLSALNQGGDIVLSGVTIGTVTQNSGGMLVLTFGAAATEARVDEAMRAVTYKDISDTPESSVKIDWSFSDGNTGAQGDGGALAATGSTTVQITAFNDAPVNTVPGGPLSAVANIDFAIAGLSVSDPDSASLDTVLHVNHGTLTVAAIDDATVFGSGTAEVTISGSVEQIAATLGAAHNVLYHGAADFSGADTLSMNTSDGAGPTGATASSSVAINVTGSVSINDVTITEGDSGTKVATFTVTRGDATAPMDVNFATSDGDATTADNDYVAASGTLHFDTGVKTQTISVTVNGDTKFESDEAFSVGLSGATNGAVISDGSGTGTISNDDAEPVGSVAIDDVTISEGDSGNKVATFTVTRSGGTAAFAVDFATADGSATTADNDYFPNAGTLNFAHGDTTKTISVVVGGDSKFESDEAFVINLSGATNGASISDGQGTGTITNDDVQPFPDLTASNAVLDHATISYTISNTGTAAAAASTTGIYLSTDGAITTSDTLILTHATPTLAQGGSDFETVSLSFPADLTPGAYFVGVIADHNGQIAESNETNNASSGIAIILGNDSANTLTGTTGDDTMLGLGGNDILHGGPGSDTIDGGGGFDTAVFSGLRSAYLVAHNGTGVHVLGPEGIDTLTSIERLAFDDVTVPLASIRTDFDGNGHSDILWQRDDATVAVWDNGQIGGGHWIADPGVVPANWHIADKGDFDGNGHSDVLWRNDDGSVSIWDNGAIGSAHIVSGAGVVPNSWHISGTGDFDGNGHDDILWRNDDGSASIWDNGDINQAHIIAGAGIIPSGWSIAGTGDFDGNGQSDILWHRDDGAVSIWDNGDINQAHIIANAGIIPSGWSIAGTGDFDGNGKSDILWHRDDGTVAIWDNGQIGAAHWIADPGVVPAGWHIAGTGDFDGNGHSDILWHNDNGAASIWDNGDINQAHIIANAGAIPSGWHIV